MTNYTNIPLEFFKKIHSNMSPSPNPSHYPISSIVSDIKRGKNPCGKGVACVGISCRHCPFNGDNVNTTFIDELSKCDDEDILVYILLE